MGFVSQVCRLVLTKNACRGASGKKGRGREVLDPPLGRVFFLPVCQPAFFSFAGLPAGLCSSRFWDHGRTVMGFVSQVCRLVLTKNACRGASERGERTRSPRSPSWTCFFLPVCQPGIFSSPVCQPVFALQAFAGDSPAIKRALFIFADKRVAASAAYPPRCRSRDTPVPTVERTCDAIPEVMERGEGGGGMVRRSRACFKKQEYCLNLLLERVR